jgi:hypothetical protein
MRFAFFSRGFALIAVAGIALSACSRGSLPVASTEALSAANDTFAPSGITLHGNDYDLSILATNPCKHPANGLLCVEQGHSAKLKATLTCKTSTGVPVSCGSVHWGVKTSNKGLKASFKPNPGNPTYETVKASKKTKPGNYSQTIYWKCSKCTPGNTGPLQIIVLKK